MVDPRRVLTFREVARLGSFSRAAEALSLTQPAVSQQVAALERQAGARLLERGPGGLRSRPPARCCSSTPTSSPTGSSSRPASSPSWSPHAARELRDRRVPERARHPRAAGARRG